LAPFCESGEHMYCGGWSGPSPDGWQIDADSFIVQMVWDSALPDADE